MHAWLIAALVVSWVLVAALAGMLFVLIKQHGELIMYQHDLDHRLEVSSFNSGREYERTGGDPTGAEAQGLPVGTEAPEFALADLAGAEKKVEDYRGEPFVIAFFSDTCGYCLNMAPEIGKLDANGRPLVLVSHGDPERHRQIAAENSWHSDVLIEPEWDVMQSYLVMGTPSGYLVDSQGRIASRLAVGADAVLELMKAKPIDPTMRARGPDPGSESGNGHVAGVEALPGDAPGANGSDGGSEAAVATATSLTTRDVSESNVVRDGLPAGTEAPNFVLPDLDGKAHGLVDYRGKRVLLVFSDVSCGPCEAMSPDLVKLAEKQEGKIQVLMISRGDEGENRRKAEAFGYPFPVLLQKSWEISKQYGMFATPIGFLIDENGIIEKEVAVGPEPILDLV
jgi:peroxiredoxin